MKIKRTHPHAPDGFPIRILLNSRTLQEVVKLVKRFLGGKKGSERKIVWNFFFVKVLWEPGLRQGGGAFCPNHPPDARSRRKERRVEGGKRRDINQRDEREIGWIGGDKSSHIERIGNLFFASSSLAAKLLRNDSLFNPKLIGISHFFERERGERRKGGKFWAARVPILGIFFPLKFSDFLLFYWSRCDLSHGKRSTFIEMVITFYVN